MHWGNIGSFLAGLSTVVIAIAALIRGPGALRAWQARQRAQAEAEHEKAQTARLERQQYQSGWSALGTDNYGVVLAASREERERAAREVASGQPTAYIVLRVAEDPSVDADRADSLRQLIEDEGHISKPPTRAEIVYLRKGQQAMAPPSRGRHLPARRTALRRALGHTRLRSSALMASSGQWQGSEASPGPESRSGTLTTATCWRRPALAS